MAQLNITLDTELLHGLFTKDSKDEAFSKLMEAILNQVLLAQSTEQLGAEPYERSDDRTAYRNGFRDKPLTTRIGSIILRRPRHRNGKFSTDMYERYQRSEQALMLSMIEMVINGVSTRKIEKVTEELCGKSFSKSMVSDLCKKLDPIVEAFKKRPLEADYPFVMVDAIYIKVRENGRVQSRGLLIAVGINDDGQREVIGFGLANSESETSWSEFFIELKARGLKAPRLIPSDNHLGLVAAIRKHFQGASWQHCQTHFSRNLLDQTPKSVQPKLKEEIRSVYEATDPESTKVAKNQLMDKYESTAPKAMNLLDEAFDDITAVLCLPLKYRKRLGTTNGVERLNEEIRRREGAIRIFPNEASALRLMGALLMEQGEKWSTGRKYFDMDVSHQEKQAEEAVEDAASYSVQSNPR
ncbi:MAG TPA: IS256 family transposase [Clostridiales bacterium]|nr:IS256 family transposase [Clostridiales bacterium]